MKLENTATLGGRSSKRVKRATTKGDTIIEKNDNVERIELNDYDFTDKIYKNMYGEVKICQNRTSQKFYAMKIFKKINNLQAKNVEHILGEYKILSTVYHPFIIELKGVNNTDQYTLNYLLEFIQGGDLCSLLRANKNFPIEQAKFYIASVITAIDYLHHKNIIFRDLKPENILICNNGYIKLFDFCYAKTMKTNVTYTICSMPEYCPPELLNKSGYSKNSDFWGIGLLLYEMLFSNNPFTDKDTSTIYEKVRRGKIVFPKNCNKNAKNLIKHLLNTDPQKRIGCGPDGIAEIVDHPFFERFDWKGLLYKTLEAPYTPVVDGAGDTSNFIKIENNDFDDDIVAVNPDKDPFCNW